MSSWPKPWGLTAGRVVWINGFAMIVAAWFGAELPSCCLSPEDRYWNVTVSEGFRGTFFDGFSKETGLWGLFYGVRVVMISKGSYTPCASRLLSFSSRRGVAGRRGRSGLVGLAVTARYGQASNIPLLSHSLALPRKSLRVAGHMHPAPG
ncbi:uncharacterized protein BDZ83DRAFT_318931 [Colletotrichum acutatum]|uniref:Uncharacterized protein n=1 Tax=Glomerella acutata TaxID=27357 RepID=A0AAD8UN07_GLOAC|nr:uncharacterized protein BDZ83DRAFT_318931 [Colletotrichum acutatum]KAK1724955.1 hypothetical protein BDZ83DRAFT_318931 [Colletotrichum acutatum]